MTNETPPSTRLRYLVLLCVSLMPTGAHVCFRMTSGLQTHLMSPAALGGMGLTQSSYALLASSAGWAGLVMPVVGGLLVDSRASRYGVALFLLIVVVGQTAFSIGVSLHSFPLAVAGRLVLGVGEGTLIVAQGAICAQWFRGTELTFAVALTETAHGLVRERERGEESLI
jgi:MFS family permease